MLAVLVAILVSAILPQPAMAQTRWQSNSTGNLEGGK
jgi:hypothetical protein